MAKIFVSRELPENSTEILRQSGEEVNVSIHNRPLNAQELLEGITGVDAVVTMLTDKIDGEVMDASGPSLRVISNYAVGFDNIDVSAATERGIVVCNTPCDEVNEAVAEMTWALLFSVARRVVEGDEAIRRGAYKGWEPDLFLGNLVRGRTLGIVGLGNIGTMAARKAKGFDMKVIYSKRTPDPEAEKELGIVFASLDELLAQADFVSLHVPLTAETTHMINKTTLAKMKPGAFLINTARGAVVNEHDLVDSLRSGHLGGAALDVFDNEPNVNAELIGMENVVLTPHIASATHESRAKMGELSTSAVLKTLRGEQPANIVNPEVWEKRRK